MNNRKNQYQLRLQRAYSKEMWINLAMLLLPSFLIAAIFAAMFYTWGVSVFLIYFVLPMFYAVDRRLRYQLTGIGNPRFSYIDGYKAFFQSNKGGIFGVLVSLVFGFAILLFFLLALFQTVPYIVHNFPEAIPYFEGTLTAYSKSSLFNQTELQAYLFDNGIHLIRPATIYMGIISYVPIATVIFFFIDENLSNHYLAGIILPDIDENVSASQARSAIRSTVSKGFVPYRFKEQIKMNWTYYVIYSLVYGRALYGASFITTNNINLVPITFMLVPSFGIILALYLNYFCLINRYTILEENKDVVLASISVPMRTTIYQTFHAKEYIHGEESKVRGSFIPMPSYDDPRQIKGNVVNLNEDKGDKEI